MRLAFYIHIVHIYHSGYGQSECRILYTVEEQSESFLMLNGIMAFYSLSECYTHACVLVAQLLSRLTSFHLIPEFDESIECSCCL